MTVNELILELQKWKDAGFGDVEIGIPLDQYNQWINGIDKIRCRPFINCLAICDHSTENGITFDELYANQQLD